MMRLVFMALLLGAAAPVSIELPGEFVPFADIKGGPSAETINANCLSCHSAEMVLNQPHLSRIEWQGEVTKMRNVYKAPVAASDDTAIVDWLVAMQAGRSDITAP
jgi:cytochrome c553